MLTSKSLTKIKLENRNLLSYNITFINNDWVTILLLICIIRVIWNLLEKCQEWRRYFRLYPDCSQNHTGKCRFRMSVYDHRGTFKNWDILTQIRNTETVVALDNLRTVGILTLIVAVLWWQKITRQHFSSFLHVIVRSFWHACLNVHTNCRCLSMNVTVNRILVFGTRAPWQNICCRLWGVYLTFSSFFPDEFNTADMFCTSRVAKSMIRFISHPFTQSLINGAMIRVPVDSRRGFVSGSNDTVRKEYERISFKESPFILLTYNNTRFRCLCIGKFIINGKNL